MSHFLILRCTATLTALLTLTGSTSTVRADTPETVVVTYRPKTDADKQLLSVIAAHWQTARRLNLVLPLPHIVVETQENKHSYIVEIFSWRDASLPDNAPDQITTLWKQMSSLTEPRDGHPGVEFNSGELISK